MNIRKLIAKLALTAAAICWAGNDEKDSSRQPSSEPQFNTGKVDKEFAMQRGEVLCISRGGVESGFQYEPPWGSPGTRGSLSAARSGVKELDSILKVEKLKPAPKSCLENLRAKLEMKSMVALYGAPLSENPYDAWMYRCKDKSYVTDAKYKELSEKDQALVNRAWEGQMAGIHEQMDECRKK